MMKCAANITNMLFELKETDNERLANIVYFAVLLGFISVNKNQLCTIVDGILHILSATLLTPLMRNKQ